MGIALHNFHDQHKKFPDSGEGTLYPTSGNPSTLFNSPQNATPNAAATGNCNAGNTGVDGGYSVLARLLPYMEQDQVYAAINFNYYYNDTANQAIVTGTTSAANPTGLYPGQIAIPSYLCPSNPLRPASGIDSNNWGYTDYGPTVYTDIDPAFISGSATAGTMRNKATRMDGALSGPRSGSVKGGGTTLGGISDGLSNTIAIAEDAGRSEVMPGAYPDPFTGTVNRSFHRWIEPDNGYGVSGPSNGTAANANLPGTQTAINNNPTPIGGPAGCLWNTAASNCGPNDEIFSFHGSGANVVFMDGHVTFLSSSLDPVALRFMVTAAEGIPVTSRGVSDY
jgi:prepilin-type processing-associated H-X9-DG protein